LTVFIYSQQDEIGFTTGWEDNVKTALAQPGRFAVYGIENAWKPDGAKSPLANLEVRTNTMYANCVYFDS
jgi:hypothetical protein